MIEMRAISVVASQGWRWLALVAITLPLTLIGLKLRLSSAFFMGPMLAAILFSFLGSGLRVHPKVILGSQSIIGCVVARSLDMPILLFLGAHWFSILVTICITVLSSCIVAAVLTLFSPLDRQTASWGSMPGAASVMVALAAEYGGDVRQVALMQYFRVIIVISTASLVSRFLVADHLHPAIAAAAPTTAAHPLTGVLETLLIACSGIVLGRLLRVPAGPLLVTALIGAVMRLNGLTDLVLPSWLLFAAYGAIGWFVGLQFDRRMLLAAARSLPAVFGGTVLLIAMCALAGWVLAHRLGTDDLTGYLATSPGAIDSITIIALGSSANTSVVMAVQTIRFFSIIVIAPYLVRLVGWAVRDQPARKALGAAPGA